MSAILYSKATWGVCACGHYDWMHDDTTPHNEVPVKNWGRADGHGCCSAQVENDFDEQMRCPCKQFTWVASIPHQRNVQSSTGTPNSVKG